jgi:hypothetical protein
VINADDGVVILRGGWAEFMYDGCGCCTADPKCYDLLDLKGFKEDVLSMG